jgi:hypothetical protein
MGAQLSDEAGTIFSTVRALRKERLRHEREAAKIELRRTYVDTRAVYP